MIRNANDIINHADIMQIVQRHLIVRKANGKWTAQCPWHGATAQSTAFTISPDKNTWYCFGCAAGGNVLAFLAVAHNIAPMGDGLKDAVRENFVTLVEILSGYTGDPIEYDTSQTTGPRRGDIYDALAAVNAHYRASLPAEQREYLHSRGFTDELIERYELGYAPGNTALDIGIASDTLTAAGVRKESQDGRAFDFMHDRITIPFHDHHGRAIAFSGRATKPDQQPRYLNTPDTRVFSKGGTLYNANRLPQKYESIYVIEGQLKAIALHEAGHPAVAPCGTSLPDRAVAQLQGQTVYIIADPDQAGRKAAIKHLTKLRSGQIAADIAVVIPDDDGKHLKDPDDYLAAGRPFAVLHVDWLQWLWETVAEPLDSEAQATAVADIILPVVAAHPNPLCVDATLRRLAVISSYRLHDLRAGTPAQATEPTRLRPVGTDGPSTTAQVLAAIAINLPLDPHNPNAWTQPLHWTSYQPELLSCLSEIATVRTVAANYGLDVLTALTLRPPSKWSNILYTWLSQPLPFETTQKTLAQCDMRIQQERSQTTAQEVLPCCPTC